MQTLKNLIKNTILYAKTYEDSIKYDSLSIDRQLAKGKAFVRSQGWNLEKIFVEASCNNKDPDLYQIKDRAFCSFGKKYPMRKLLMPELVPIHIEPEELVKRAAFYDMVSYIKKNPVNVLLTMKLEQLFGNLQDLCLFIKHELEPRGIELQSIAEDFNTHSSEGRQLLKMLDSFKEFKYLSENKRIWN